MANCKKHKRGGSNVKRKNVGSNAKRIAKNVGKAAAGALALSALGSGLYFSKYPLELARLDYEANLRNERRRGRQNGFGPGIEMTNFAKRGNRGSGSKRAKRIAKGAAKGAAAALALGGTYLAAKRYKNRRQGPSIEIHDPPINIFDRRGAPKTIRKRSKYV